MRIFSVKMTRSVAVTIILSLAIGCALSQEDVTELMPTPDSGIETSTTEACYDSGWTTKCECPESSPNACGHTLTTICGGVETSFNTENLTRADCYVPGEWAEWAEWATCNVTCPQTGGWRNRTRECDSADMKPWQNAECDDSNVEWQACSCGEWASWGAFSECSATCDGGFQTRQRECQAPASLPQGAGVVCEGDAEEEDGCNTDECPLDEEEATNGVYVALTNTEMTVENYLAIRPLLQTAIISMTNNWCYRTAFNTCCPYTESKPTFPKKYVPEYVNNKTLELKGAFRDEEENALYFFLFADPQIDTCELCNANRTAAARKKRQTLNLAGSITNAVASSPTFATAVTSTASAAGFTVSVSPPISPSAATSLKATLVTTTIATTAVANATTPLATAASSAPLGLIIGVSVGGGLVLVAIILIVVVVVKKKMAKTGIAEITASGEGDGHQHERRHRELEDGNVAYPAPQYPARGAVAAVSQS